MMFLFLTDLIIQTTLTVLTKLIKLELMIMK